MMLLRVLLRNSNSAFSVCRMTINAVHPVIARRMFLTCWVQGFVSVSSHVRRSVRLGLCAMPHYRSGPAVRRRLTTCSRLRAAAHSLKNEVERIFQEVCTKKQSLSYIPQLKLNHIQKGSRRFWRAQLSITWPEPLTFENVAPRKADAEEAVFYLAYHKLKELGVTEGCISDDSHGPSNAKNKVDNIYASVAREMKSPKMRPSFCTTRHQGLWKTKLAVQWPETHSVEALAPQKRRAEMLAAEKVIQWLSSRHAIDRHHRPILYSKREVKQVREGWKQPHVVSVPGAIAKQIEDVVKNHQELCDSQECVPAVEEEGLQREEALMNAITGRPYSEEMLQERSEQMLIKQNNKHSQLPIHHMRDEIVSKVCENRVLVISGEPGCGKTTQVPQFILEHFVSAERGAHCNVVVTQPRRISAISIAERVAFERGEQVGDTIGYQVRLEKCMPQHPGAVLFCSTGILLNRLRSNPTLQGVSHIIVDEVHQRDVDTDFLMILLKHQVLQANPNVRIVLMSATINADMFSRYFDDCPILRIPGFVHPVKDHYLPEVCHLVGHQQDAFREDDVQVDYDLLTKVVDYIDRTREHGAILCFLPGWNEISIASRQLRAAFPDVSRYDIIPVHSRLSSREQARIFHAAPPGVRKIVLATNVAETSITVGDVVYVVDPGLQKELTYSKEAGMSVLSTSWVTRSSVKQRRGRAGRVRPGECFHLFPREVEERMKEFPEPEMHRIPLERLVLDCKLACGGSVRAQDFLLQAPEPPSASAVSEALKDLREIGVLDEQEELTPLGRHVSLLAMHPRLAKAVIYATFFRCVRPALASAAVLSATKEPFNVNLDNKNLLLSFKKRFEGGSRSDHITVASIVQSWMDGKLWQHCAGDEAQRSLVHVTNMNFVNALVREFADSLSQTSLLPDTDGLSLLSDASTWNENSDVPHVLCAVLCASFYPHVVRVQKGYVHKGRIVRDKPKMRTLDGHPVHIVGASVLSKGEEDLPSPSWLTFFGGTWSHERRGVLLREVSLVPPVALLLLAGNDVQSKEEDAGMLEEDSEVVLAVDGHPWMQFLCKSRHEADVLLAYRRCLQDLIDRWVSLAPKDARVEQLTREAVSVFEVLLGQSAPTTGEELAMDCDAPPSGQSIRSLIDRLNSDRLGSR